MDTHEYILEDVCVGCTAHHLACLSVSPFSLVIVFLCGKYSFTRTAACMKHKQVFSRSKEFTYTFISLIMVHPA